MKAHLLIALLAFAISACSITKSHEKTAQAQAEQAGLTEVKKSHFDASFIAPSIAFSHYKKIKIENLDLNNVKIIRSTPPHTFDTPWELDDKDRAYYQEKYASAAKKSLFDSGLYTETNSAAADTLVLKGKIIDISPHASKDDFKGRPNLMDVYSQGFGRMTVAFELYDSVTNQLVLTATDEHDLGYIWEKNDRVQNNMQIRLAFDYWLNNLQSDLKQASKK